MEKHVKKEERERLNERAVETARAGVHQFEKLRRSLEFTIPPLAVGHG